MKLLQTHLSLQSHPIKVLNLLHQAVVTCPYKLYTFKVTASGGKSFGWDREMVEELWGKAMDGLITLKKKSIRLESSKILYLFSPFLHINVSQWIANSRQS